MSTCILEMSSYNLQHLNNQLNTIELEEHLLPANLLEMNDSDSTYGEDWILDECKYSRKQKRSYSDFSESDLQFEQSKRQDVGCGATVLRDSYVKLSPSDQITFKAIILERTKSGPMDFGPYYIIEQVQHGKINIVQKEMWNRMRYISAKFDSSTHLIDNWNKVYVNDEENKENSFSATVCDTSSPTITDSESSEEEEEDDTETRTASSCSTISSNNNCIQRSSSPPRILRFASRDDIIYI